ncbi:Cysteine-rich repeat secretory protein 3 [Abeliophyllum distichum]|uniref:Cysteine-rich repeat secretory protein 3 n=1 Tax=Abeliophyllum distichum TaxID=126358 RepID=A0ABD1Q068_9LAMI
MGSPRNTLYTVPVLLVILIILELTSLSKSAPDYTSLVYKGCAKQDLADPTGVYSQALSALFGTLIAQSSKAKFFKTTTGSGQTTINGLFQCRGDLSNVDCYNCVSRLPILIDKLCGKPIAARLQLFGCYMLYEVAGFSQISGMEMLYKTCSGTNVGGAGYEEKRDTAFSSLANGIGNANGFYTTSYESVYVLGQCEGDVGSTDCVDYSYYQNGVPKRSSSSSYTSPSSSGSGQNTGKTVAIILGGAAGVGFLVIFLLFARNLTKKRDDY